VLTIGEGGPGTAAYEQCQLLSKDWDIVHISPTDILRAEQTRPGSKYAETITKFMAEKEPVPLEIMVGLIQRTMQYHISRGKYCFAIDSFPRRIDQAMAFENNVRLTPHPLRTPEL
jgi:UMP-CMP kinase